MINHQMYKIRNSKTIKATNKEIKEEQSKKQMERETKV